MWRDLHVSSDWAGIVDPLHPGLIKYGEFVQATYATFGAAGDCCFTPQTFFDQSGLSNVGYEVTRSLYATSVVELPRCVRQFLHVEKQWKQLNWMGFVADSSDGEARRTSRREIVVAWRGAVTKVEWYEEVKVMMKRPRWGNNSHVGEGEAGFNCLYTSNDKSTQHKKTSALEQANAEIRRLASAYADDGEGVSLTVTGHGLGGALALLSAHEAAAARIGGHGCVSVISFGAPSVGNLDFKQDLEELGVKTLRVVSRRDSCLNYQDSSESWRSSCLARKGSCVTFMQVKS